MAGNPHGNWSYTAIPHEWMMNGKVVKNNDNGSPHGRHGLGHGVDVEYNGRSGRRAGIGDWQGGDAIGTTFLEQCRARDCFFGCGRSHSQQTESLGHYDPCRFDWRCAVDGTQNMPLNNEVEYRLRNQYVLENMYARSSRYSTKNFVVMVVLILSLKLLVTGVMDVMHLFRRPQLKLCRLVIADSLSR